MCLVWSTSNWIRGELTTAGSENRSPATIDDCFHIFIKQILKPKLILMKKLLFCSVIFFAVMSCNESNKTDETGKMSDSMATADAAKPVDNGMNELYEKNLANLKASISAFEKEDIEGWAAMVADDAKWQGPAYGSSPADKATWKKTLEGYIAGWDSIRLVNPNYLPGVDSTTNRLDGSVRYYGQWDAVHKSGVRTSVNFYGTYDFNSDNKIVYGTEFFDVGGLMNAVSGKK
jgi:hypothetical protein